jgi:hypothetical protein
MSTPTKTQSFETKTCTRCDGSGRYSFNMLDGDRCYGCSGKGVQLTKRGAAAREFYLASLTRRYDEIQTGWRVFAREYGWTTVTGVVVADAEMLANRSLGAVGVKGTGGSTGIPQEWNPHTHRIDTKRICFVGNADQTLTAYADKDERDAKLQAALDYQATLA